MRWLRRKAPSKGSPAWVDRFDEMVKAKCRERLAWPGFRKPTEVSDFAQAFERRFRSYDPPTDSPELTVALNHLAGTVAAVADLRRQRNAFKRQRDDLARKLLIATETLEDLRSVFERGERPR